MDLKSLKLELLERISLMEDEVRLMALKRLLDAPRGYGIPNEHLSVVKEGEEPYLKLEDRSYSAAEVRILLNELRNKIDHEETGLAPEDVAQLERSRERFLRGEGKWYSLEEIEAGMKDRRKKRS
ncbi:MAG: hypothetical protein IPN44_02085 [Flavobacteriales bacterium]|nr:hypothetical protein [Flavobacteriales bacterium]